MVLKDRFHGIWDIAGKGTCGKTKQREITWCIWVTAGNWVFLENELDGGGGRGEMDRVQDEKGPTCHTEDLDLTSGWSQVMNFHCFKRYLLRDKYHTRTLGESTGRAGIQWFNQCFLSPYCLLVAILVTGHMALCGKRLLVFWSLIVVKGMINR